MSRIFLNGDSITYGYWDEQHGGWANRLKTKVMQSRDYSHEVINFALGNQTLNKIVDRFPSQLEIYGRAKSLGIFMLGGSDSVIRRGQTLPQNPLSDFERQLRQLGGIVTNSRVTPIFVGMYPVDEERSNPSPVTGDCFTTEWGLKYNDAIKKYAESIDAPYVNLEPVWDFSDKEVFSFDGVHPSELGHKIIADEVAAVVNQRLASPLLSYLR